MQRSDAGLAEARRAKPAQWAVRARWLRGEAPSGAPSGMRRWLVVRALATLAVALFTAGAWGPWLALTFTFDQPGAPAIEMQVDGQSGFLRFLTLAGTDVPQAALGVLAFGWGAITVVGLLCPVLWQRMSVRSARTASWVFLGWMLLATVAATITANALAREALHPTLDSSLVVLGWQTAWGFWMTALGLAAAWGAVGLLRTEVSRSQAEVLPLGRSQAPRSRLEIAGASAVTAGALAWGLGFIALPWATTNCASVTLSLNHYVNGACAGLDAGDALSTSLGLANQLTVSASPSEIALLAYGLLAGGALLVVVGSWRRVLSWTLYVWLTAWLMLAGVTALVTLRGVGIIVRTAPALSTASRGAWVSGPGVYVCLLGLLLVTGGLAALWWQALRGVYEPARLMKASIR